MRPHQRQAARRGLFSTLTAGVIAIGLTALAILPMAAAYMLVAGLDQAGKQLAAWARGKSDPSGAAGKAPLPDLPLCHDWPEKTPDLVLMLSGESLGYMRPCGCSENQHGGIARRASLLEWLSGEKKFPDPVRLDLGNLVPGSGLLEKLRYEYGLRALDKLGYHVVGVGDLDLAVSFDSIMGQGLNLEKAKLAQAGFLHRDENTRADWETIAPITQLIESNGIKVGVGAAMGDSLGEAGKLLDSSVRHRPLADTVKLIVERMNAEKAEFRVLLLQGTLAEATAFADSNKGMFQVIVCKSDREDGIRDDPKMVGDTLVAWTGRKGKGVGLVGYWKGGSPALRYEFAPLDSKYPEKPEVLDSYVRYVAAVRDGKFDEKTPRVPHPSGQEYVGPKRCGECHTEAYAKWGTTGHGHALETLTLGKKNNPPGQDRNPDCLKCHVVGWGYTGGFLSIDKSPHLAGNGCENCHGPGSGHAADPWNEKFLAPMRRSRNTVESTCRTCHDAENSINFKFDTYWPKVAHPGLNDARAKAPKKP